MTLSEMENFGTYKTAEQFTSTEFQDLLNQKYKYAFFNRRNYIGSAAEQLADELVAYLNAL